MQRQSQRPTKSPASQTTPKSRLNLPYFEKSHTSFDFCVLSLIFRKKVNMASRKHLVSALLLTSLTSSFDVSLLVLAVNIFRVRQKCAEEIQGSNIFCFPFHSEKRSFFTDIFHSPAPNRKLVQH